jgi:hypothetical protein
VTANPNQGWRIDPKPGAKLRRTEAGRFSLAMEITNDGEHVSDVEHVYTGAELEALYSEMRQLYAEGMMIPPVEDRAAIKAEMGRVW